MLLQGNLMTDGQDLIRYLDEKFLDVKQLGHTVTGIVIGTVARERLSETCQKVMGQKRTKDLTINRYRGALLIEDGVNPERLEVIQAKSPTLPVDGDLFSKGLKRVP